MKPRYLAFSSLIAISTMAVAILGVAAENNAVTLNQGFAGNVTYNLDITSLNASNKTLNTSNGNPISFYVGSYDGGTFSANGYIKNKTAISGLESISVTGLSAGASFTVQYGWADNDWDVTDGVIDADHLTYDFGGESPSFFSISSSAAASVASIALSYSCNATDEPTKYLLTFSDNGNNTYSVTDCKSSATDVIIPSSYNGKPVVSIGDYAFDWHSSLSSVSIPDGVTSIGSGAFYFCSALASIVIPDSVTYIGNQAFCRCPSITSISVGQNNARYGLINGVLCDNTMNECLLCPRNITGTVTVPNPITSISSDAFSNCSLLESITLSSNISSIPGDAFSGCSSLTSITILSSITDIGDSAFSGCSSLSSIDIPNSVASIGQWAFKDCSSLSAISIPSNVTEISYAAFQNCSSLSSIDMPNSITSIGACAFQGCTALNAISIPNKVNFIASDAFSGCSSLGSIIIPDSVTAISDNTFKGCTSLSSVTIPDHVTYIGGQSFRNCSSLSSVTIPSYVTEIGYAAFEYCTSLSSFTFEGSVKQWENVSKGLSYLNSTQVTQIVCSDGTVSV